MHPQDYGDLCFAHLPLSAPVSDFPLWLRLSWALEHGGSHCRTLQHQSCHRPPRSSLAASPAITADRVLTKGNFLCFSVGNQWRISNIIPIFSRQKLRGSALHVGNFTVQFSFILLHQSTWCPSVKAQTKLQSAKPPHYGNCLFQVITCNETFSAKALWLQHNGHIMGFH